MIQIHDILVLSQRPFVARQAAAALSGTRRGGLGRLLGRLGRASRRG